MAGLNDRTYMRRRDALRKKRDPCWLCGDPIDYTADWRDRNSFTADHVNPRGNGGALYGELKAAHRGCNASRGKRVTIVTTQPATRRQW